MDDRQRIRGRLWKIRALIVISMIAGFLLHLLAQLAFPRQTALLALTSALGSIVSVAGAVLYARLKGRSGWMALVCFFGIIGYLILFLSDSRCLRCSRKQPREFRDCVECGAPL